MIRARRKVNLRWFQALSLASIAAWVSFFGLAWFAEILLNASDPNRAAASSGLLGLSAIWGIPVILVACFLIGAPALLVSEWLKFTRWWQAALIGAAAGSLLIVVVRVLWGVGSALPADLGVVPAIVIVAITGACAGVAAWGSLWLDGKYRSDVRANER